jgi:3-oxoacyl-[acyl-carrier protein] reductase
MNVRRLADRVVLITGAESGIGREIAQRAAAEGAIIAAIGLDAAALDSLRAELEGAGHRAGARTADVSDAAGLAAAVDDLARELGPFHVVHANAGILAPPYDDH